MMTVSPSLSSRYRHRLSPSLLGSLPPFPPQTRTMKQLVPFSLAGNIFILAGIGVLVFFTMEHAIEDGVAADMPIVRRGGERGRESEESRERSERENEKTLVRTAVVSCYSRSVLVQAVCTTTFFFSNSVITHIHTSITPLASKSPPSSKRRPRTTTTRVCSRSSASRSTPSRASAASYPSRTV